MKKYGFTLAEVLITLAIIGIVAALTIPSVISNYQQQEFKTGLKKAVSVLNEAIQTNIAQDGETPYETDDLFKYLTKHMSIIKTTAHNGSTEQNESFYTTDGMRYEMMPHRGFRIYENDNNMWVGYKKWHCGSLGLNNNPNNTTENPCVILVDVNGDKKPNPRYVTNTMNVSTFVVQNSYPSPSDKKVQDIFTIMITDEKAIPFGVVAQRAMYSK